jgi:hypothetical protein
VFHSDVSIDPPHTTTVYHGVKWDEFGHIYQRSEAAKVFPYLWNEQGLTMPDAIRDWLQSVHDYEA